MRQVLGVAEQRSQGRAPTSLRITPRRNGTRRDVPLSNGRRDLAQGRPEYKRLAGRAAGRLSPPVQAIAEAGSTRYQLHPAAAPALGRTEEHQALSLQGKFNFFETLCVCIYFYIHAFIIVDYINYKFLNIIIQDN